MGEQGKIEQTEAIMTEVENLKKRREELNNFGLNPQKVMKVPFVSLLCSPDLRNLRGFAGNQRH